MSRWDRLGALLTLLDRPEATSADGHLSQESVEAVAALVESDSVALFEFCGATSTVTGYREWLDSPGLVDVDREPPPDAVATFWSLFWASPFCTYTERPGHRGEVVMQQDFHPGHAWRRTPMYVDYLSRAPIEAEIILPLAAPDGLSRRLLLTRQVRRDYDEEDRLVLRLLRPHLTAAVGRAARDRLTLRQLDIVRRAASGATNEAIGHSLGLSPGTVRKHLENAYARLGARNRADAIARAFPDGVWP